jgi:DNA gyrase subunit A
MATREADFVEQIFVASTHTPLLFFSSAGMAYALKVYKLPLGTATSRGKPLSGILPLEKATISTILQLPEDEEEWASLYLAFATSSGKVRRNVLADFSGIRSNGKIAMKLSPDEYLVNVYTCTEENDLLLATHHGKCIRFPITAIRVFSGRSSEGVAGIRLAAGDKVVSMSMLAHSKFTMEERDTFLKRARALRSGESDESGTLLGGPESDGTLAPLSDKRFEEMLESEEMLLIVTENGFGKRSSSYEYRQAGRGGKGLASMQISKKTGYVVDCFPISQTDQLMLVTDGGQLIRSRVNEIRIAGRNTQGVTIFRVGKTEKVVSCDRVREDSDSGSFDDESVDEQTAVIA